MKKLCLFFFTSVCFAAVDWPEGYLKLSEIRIFEESLQKQNPFISLIKYGESKEKNPLIAISFKSRNKAPKKILITASTHGDELITTEMLRQYIHSLAKQYDKISFFNETEVNFILVVNPDGYSKRSRFANGIDPNRNHPYPGNENRTLNPCVEHLDRFVLENGFSGVLDLHAFGRYILYPWSFTEESLPDSDRALFETIAKKMAVSNNYTTGSLAKTLYGSRGSSSDYYYWKQKKIYPFAIEMGASFTPAKDEFDSYFKEIEPSLTIFIQEVSKNPLPKGVEKIEEEKEAVRFSLGRDYMMSLARPNAGKSDPAKILKDSQKDIQEKLSKPVRIYLDSWRELAESFEKEKTELALTTLSEAKNILNTVKNVEVLMIGKENDEPYRCSIVAHKKDIEEYGSDLLKKKKLILPRYLQPICLKYAEILFKQNSIAMNTIDYAYTSVTWPDAFKKMMDEKEGLFLTASSDYKDMDRILGSFYVKNSTIFKASETQIFSDKIILSRKNLDPTLSTKLKKILSEIKYPDNMKLRVETFMEPTKEFWNSYQELPKEYLLSEE
jgi:hypothetical protein